MKTVLITGATKGIGLSLSKKAKALGYRVVGVARNRLDSFPGDLFLADLQDIKATEQLILELQKRYSIDMLVNNVGIALPEPLETLSLDHLYSVYDLNVRVAVQLAQSFVPHMKQQKWGRIVNISSRAIHGLYGRTSYAAAKSALIGCTKTWALELAPFGITVNAVAPGPTETELFRQKHPKGSEEEQETLSQIPMKRIGSPEEIAAGILFFLSPEASFITGETLHIDGGASL